MGMLVNYCIMSEFWNARFDTPEYIFGTAPNAFLAAQAHRLRSGQRALAVADGEGRNGVWLAEQGLDVHAVEVSPNAIAKANRLAETRGVTVHIEQADLLTWEWPVATFDVVAGIFFQFGQPHEQSQIIAGMKRATRPGGMVLLEGYSTRQLQYQTGGPSNPAQLWTEDLLRGWFVDWEVLHLEEHEPILDEGRKHVGRSAVVDCVARRPG
jgi:cyclopropane fatty-acyl-phospholipid synthase-like methyltransferase